MNEPKRIAVIGGGAAGFFAAIRCAGLDRAAQVTIFEATAHPLAKVRVSGGGRCNVTHACFEPRDLVSHYPRGSRELLGAFHRFGPRETIGWFAERGVELKTEADGRMFPVTDESATIIACLHDSAGRAGVQLRLRASVREITRERDGSFLLTLANGETAVVDKVLLATGGNKGSAGIAIAQALGHAIESQVPSLFTFHIDDGRLRGLEGLSVPHGAVAIDGTRLREAGAVLVTHWGLSGPAILRLSAWGARELHAMDYRGMLVINWVAPRSAADVAEGLAAYRAGQARKHVGSVNPFDLPARLWERLVEAAGIKPAVAWSGLSNPAARALGTELTAGRFAMTGKSMNKEEFVTCGGVRLREVDFRRMESRLCPGLFFAGEVLDIDGVTGGFNFQAAWTTGWLAGEAMASGGRPTGPAN
jgi:predicted Rossmann fold flavoprotein